MGLTLLDTLSNIATSVADLDAENSSATGTITSVPASVTSVSLLAANVDRKGIVLFNDSNSTAYIAYSGTASLTAFTIKMPGGSLYESQVPSYRGAVSVIWANANGSMRVTELT